MIRDLKLQLKECNQELVESEMERSDLEFWADKMSREMFDVKIEKELRQVIRRLRNKEYRLVKENIHLDQKAKALGWRNEVLEKIVEVVTRQRDEVTRFVG